MALQMNYDFRGFDVTDGYVKVMRTTVTNESRKRRHVRCEVGFFKTQKDSGDQRNVLKHESYRLDFVSPDNCDDVLAFCYTELKKLDEFADAEDV
jgi:hypothetical protein